MAKKRKSTKKRESTKNDATEPDVEVWAAGGIVTDAEGRLLVAHRPHYDDWSFPKGKLDAGETLEQCAHREVEEETGFSCALRAPIAGVRYVDQKGRLKEVRYWHMAIEAGQFIPNDEVDRIEWMKPTEVDERLSYQRDRDVLAAFVALASSATD